MHPVHTKTYYASLPHTRLLLTCVVLVFAGTGCSLRSMAVSALGDALAEGGGSYGRDDDPEFVRDASAFGLKTMESLLDAEPEHRGLLLAAARGFVQYAYAYLDTEADYIEEKDYERAEHLKKRALGFYKRGARYGLRGLDVAVPDFLNRLRRDPKATLSELGIEEVGLLYWTAAAWAKVVGLDKGDPLAADLDLVGPLVDRAHALDPGFDAGALHDFRLSWDASRPAAMGGTLDTADEHLKRALAASSGQRLSTLVSYAESVCVRRQDKGCFDQMLGDVLAFDLGKAPEYRLMNILAQKRARWLLGSAEDLFL